jgi:hypothetical protein
MVVIFNFAWIGYALSTDIEDAPCKKDRGSAPITGDVESATQQ